MSYFVLLALAGFVSAQSVAATKVVKIAFVEALAPKDTTSSERFQKDYDAAIKVASKALQPALKACGYAFETSTKFYDAGDPLQAREAGAQLQGDGTWVIVGPRRSNHYLLLVQGAPEVPSVSLMASSEDVMKLDAKHVTLSPSNIQLANAAARETKHRLSTDRRPLSYISITSSDCSSCKDFEVSFNQAASRLGIERLASVEVAGEAPETEDIIASLKRLKPGFVLVPNYSKVSSYLMAKLNADTPGSLFVGGDGWGDANFGFIHGSEGATGSAGISVRGFPPFNTGLKGFSLGRELASQSDLPNGGPALGILRALGGLKNLLCRSKPKDRAAFARGFPLSSRKEFSAPWGVSIYELTNGSLQYKKQVKAAQK